MDVTGLSALVTAIGASLALVIKAITKSKSTSNAVAPGQLTGKGGQPLPIPDHVKVEHRGGYTFHAIPRKMNYKEIAQWYGLPKDEYSSYNAWIRAFSPFGTNEKFQVFKPNVKKMTLLNTGTMVPAPEPTSEWKNHVEFTKEMEKVKPFWHINKPHTLDKYDWDPVPLEDYMHDNYEELYNNKQRLLYVLEPRLDKGRLIKIGVAGTHSSNGKAIGRLRQYLIAYGLQREDNEYSGVNVYFIVATKYNANVEPKNSRILKLETKLKRLIKDNNKQMKHRGSERTTASVEELRGYINSLIELPTDDMQDQESTFATQCKTKTQMKKPECKAMFPDDENADLEI
jgi:hypothetical protein